MIRPREVAEGIVSFATRTPTLPPATHTQSYALGTRELVLVEPATPFDDERRAWLEWARALVGAGRALQAIVITHHHADHVSGAEVFARELGAPLWAHELTAARLPELPIARWLRDDETLTLDGPTAQNWRVLHTPGHAPGHVCLFETTSRYVVVGDMVASEGTILVERRDGDMALYIASLRRLAELGAELALPAHGSPIAEPTRLFEHYVEHRLMREEKIRATVEGAGEAGITPRGIVPLAYDDTPRVSWPFALLSVEAHLDKLVRDGRVRSDGERYCATR